MAEGTIVSLQLCVGHRQPMASKEEVVALAGQGLEGDRHANAQSHRQILLMEKEILDGLDLEPGTIRENVTVSGLPLHQLSEGQLLRIGEGVSLELTGLAAPCQRMDEIRRGLQQTLEGRRGVLARVVQGGRIRLQDRVRVEVASP